MNKNADRMHSFNIWNYAEGNDSYYNSMLVDLSQPHGQEVRKVRFYYFERRCSLSISVYVNQNEYFLHSGNGAGHINEVGLRRFWLVLTWAPVSLFNCRCGKFLSVGLTSHSGQLSLAKSQR